MLDTNAFIYFLTGQEPYAEALIPLFKRVQQGALQVVVSVVTEMELLVRPRRDGDTEAVERIEDLLSEDGFRVVPVDRPIARLGAEVRARHRLALADAIIVSTAIATDCEAVISNDGRWSRVTEVPVIHLDDVVEPGQKPNPRSHPS